MSAGRSEKVSEFLDRCTAQIERSIVIDKANYADIDVKRGLRNADGTGVMAGLTQIGNVQGYYIQDGEKMPMPGQLIYRGIDVNDLVSGFMQEQRFGFEETAYLLLFEIYRQAHAQRFPGDPRRVPLPAGRLYGGYDPRGAEQGHYEQAGPRRVGAVLVRSRSRAGGREHSQGARPGAAPDRPLPGRRGQRVCGEKALFRQRKPLYPLSEGRLVDGREFPLFSPARQQLHAGRGTAA